MENLEFKGTKGNFSDGSTGWKIDDRITNGNKGFEIHYSDDGECITDHVYTLEDAKLIASAPDLLEALLETDKDLCVLENTFRQIEKTDSRADGMVDLVIKWRERNKLAIEKALK